MDDTYLHNNNRSTSKYFLQSAHQDKGSHFLVSSLGGVVLSHLSVCRLVFGRWLLSSDLAAIPALSLLLSLSFPINCERGAEGRKEKTSLFSSHRRRRRRRRLRARARTHFLRQSRVVATPERCCRQKRYLRRENPKTRAQPT